MTGRFKLKSFWRTFSRGKLGLGLSRMWGSNSNDLTQLNNPAKTTSQKPTNDTVAPAPSEAPPTMSSSTENVPQNGSTIVTSSPVQESEPVVVESQLVVASVPLEATSTTAPAENTTATTTTTTVTPALTAEFDLRPVPPSPNLTTKSSAPSVVSNADTPASPMPPPPSTEKALTPKELKEKKKAEKLARRQQNKAAAPDPSAPKQQQQQQQKGQQQQQKGQQQQPKGQQQQPKGGKKIPQDGPVSTIRLGAIGPGTTAKASPAVVKEAEVAAEPPRATGLVGLLKDLESEQNEKKKKPVFGIDNAHPDVHPAILTLGMQINKHVIVSSSARCMGFLLAIKRVIEDYETPEDSSLNRHLPGAYLSHQINYLISARPMATAMGNTIRWLKTEISNISPDITDEVAKRQLVDKIENFIHEKLTAADEMIINTVCERYIEDDDVIVTFSKSQVVEKTLLEAKRRGRKFRVVVVDSRPLKEGKNLLKALCEAGIECSYIHLYALDYMMQDATKVFLGAHAIMANGALYSRSGTAVTAMAAHSLGVPVLVLCETIKFSDKINIDGIVNNELGPPELLVNTGHGQLGYLDGWKDVPNTTVVSFLYDVTPAECLSVVICEHGCVTPEGVSNVLRISGMER
ncbi:hypothetical protein BDD12DRAFT_843804 [Trichophaea hybrida]|nr:hypothetical protein BDD12DRAFT_843804 [Trichophaea hybrida]